MTTTTKTTELANGLRALLEAEDCDEAIATLARSLKSMGAECEIETDDEAPGDLGQDGVLWVTSTHRLIVAGEEVADWTRCARGHYGDQGRTEYIDKWTVEEDTDGGDTLPEPYAVALRALGLEDDLPDVPEPPKATDLHQPSDDGEYCVYWETVGDDEGPLRRYDSYEAALAVCDQYQREFSARQQNALCGYSVRVLVDGKWESAEDDDR